MKVLYCGLYLAVLGIGMFLLGRWIPRKLFHPNAGYWRCFAFEKEGRLYEKLKIRKWHSHLPDMSRLFPRWMPPKHLQGNYSVRLETMILETCIAELVHLTLCVLGFGCVFIWPGPGGIAVSLCNLFLLNLPFVLIQRYNRPRLLRLQHRLKQTEKEKVYVRSDS